jgi:hypothetical protein
VSEYDNDHAATSRRNRQFIADFYASVTRPEGPDRDAVFHPDVVMKSGAAWRDLLSVCHATAAARAR